MKKSHDDDDKDVKRRHKEKKKKKKKKREKKEELMFTDSDDAETEDNEGGDDDDGDDTDEVFPDGPPTLELMGLVSPIVPEPLVEVRKVNDLNTHDVRFRSNAARNERRRRRDIDLNLFFSLFSSLRKGVFPFPEPPASYVETDRRSGRG